MAGKELVDMARSVTRRPKLRGVYFARDRGATLTKQLVGARHHRQEAAPAAPSIRGQLSRSATTRQHAGMRVWEPAHFVPAVTMLTS